MRGGEERIFIETDVLIYATLSGDPRYGQARRKIEAVASLPELTVLPLTGDVISLALELCEKHRRRRQGYFDMQIAALMLRHRIGLILTENTKDFDDIEGITAVNPFSSAGA